MFEISTKIQKILGAIQRAQIYFLLKSRRCITAARLATWAVLRTDVLLIMTSLANGFLPF